MEDDFKSRSRRVLGDAGLAKLEAATVAVFGLGGVGSSCAEALARGGIGTLILIDRDRVTPSNINRQALAFRSTIGREKAEVMAAMICDIDPDIRTFVSTAFVRESAFTETAGYTPLDLDVPERSVSAVLESFPRPEFIVDAVDTITTKLALARYAQDAGIPIVASMGGANKTDPTALRFADLYDTVNCPLCRSMRKTARNRGIERLPVLYSCEAPVKVAAEAGAQRRERTELGTMSYYPPIMGQMLASYVIRELLEPGSVTLQGQTTS